MNAKPNGKSRLRTLFFIFALSNVVHGQGVVLSTGDVWTYRFTTLDFIGTQFGYPDIFGAQFAFSYSVLSYPPNVNYECFEGLPPDGLLGFGSQPIGGNGIFLATNAWQDLAGSVRFTVTSGSFLIRSLTFTVWQPSTSGPSMYDVYSTTMTPILADDRTLTMSINSVSGSPPSLAVIGVTAGSAGNPNPSMISFHVEYSDDLASWTALHSFDYAGTNTQPTIATNLTIGQTTLFGDVQAGTSSHRFYRAVEEAQ